MKRLWVTVALAGVCAGAWSAEEIKLRGAAEVIRAVTAEQEAMREKNTGNKDSIENFLATVKAYMQGMDAQTPDAAAEGWLKLADQLLETGVAEDEDEDRWSYRCYREKETAFMSLVGALPPPDAWAQIREGLAKRQDVEYASRRSLLQVLMAYLAQDTEAAQNHLAVLTEKEKGDKPDVSELESFLKDGKQNVDDRRLKRLNDTLARTVSIYGSIAIPDLVSLTSPEEAEALLRKVFARRIPFDTVAGEETLALAQRIALEMRDDWVMPHWSLVTGSPEGETLYDLFVKRFLPFEQEPKPDEVESTFYEPSHYHKMRPICEALARLITPKLNAGKIDEAVGLVLPYVSYALKAYPKDRKDVTDFSRQRGAVPAKAQYDFHCQLLAKVPDCPINKGFIMSGIASGQVPAVEQLLTERLNTPGLSPEQRYALQDASVTLLLATDRIAEAIALRTEILADASKSRKDDRDARVRYALDTAALAALVNDTQVQNASLDTAIKRWKKGLESDESFWGGSTEKLILALEQCGRASEVEPLLVELLVQKDDALTHLVNFYARHNRMADVVTLLEDAPWWDEAHDVLQLIDYDIENPIANAFHETGRTAEAEQLLTAVMRESHSEDWAYELLLKMAGDKLDGFLVQMDALYARDAFEERPLIWKAEALRRLKRLEEAEQVIRHALKVDPTDGEQPAGERVRAYTVLGDILADRGKAEDAKFFRDVVEAVRLAGGGGKKARLGLGPRGPKPLPHDAGV
ncbi:MAG: hypothetical protein FWH21_08235, partial [Kiritimatiellaeota bacterium]|nr:hypothetical protein [Kiritimatiellota bacterium]